MTDKNVPAFIVLTAGEEQPVIAEQKRTAEALGKTDVQHLCGE